MNDNFNQKQPKTEPTPIVKKYSFYFRCVACNRPINQHSRLMQEDSYCDRCSSLAYDYSAEKEYQHNNLTDEILACYHATINDE